MNPTLSPLVGDPAGGYAGGFTTLAGEFELVRRAGAEHKFAAGAPEAVSERKPQAAGAAGDRRHLAR